MQRRTKAALPVEIEIRNAAPSGVEPLPSLLIPPEMRLDAISLVGKVLKQGLAHLDAGKPPSREHMNAIRIVLSAGSSDDKLVKDLSEMSTAELQAFVATHRAQLGNAQNHATLPNEAIDMFE